MRKLIFPIAAMVLYSVSSRYPGDPAQIGDICAVPASPGLEARLLAAERDNGCLDDDAAPPDSWPPGWNTAAMAGGDVAPARVVIDPYPTLHSLAIDAERNKVFMSDPNRHALWSYGRLAASKGRESVEPDTGIRGPSTGMMFIAAVAVDRERQEIYTVDNDIGDRMRTAT